MDGCEKPDAEGRSCSARFPELPVEWCSSCCVTVIGNLRNLVKEQAFSNVALKEQNDKLVAAARKRCSVCSAETDLCCMDCLMDLRVYVHVCENAECRKRHEEGEQRLVKLSEVRWRREQDAQ